jgi:tetratricopeptide (TPR) repeat protein
MQVATIFTYMMYLQNIFMHGNAIEQLACNLMIPELCTTVGSLIASICIQDSQVISQAALDYFSLGLNSDVASSRLKLASVCYCVGDIVGAEAILRGVENRYDFRLWKTICGCYHFPKQHLPFHDFNSFTIEQYIRLQTAMCVTFLPNEINCAPPELQHEMFRSSPYDIPHRGVDDCWMDWAVVDSPPYLYYLQYKTYQRLARYNDQQRALNNLMLAIDVVPNLAHKETALNLLGQCLEQENREDHALKCYIRSLNIRPRNNSANFHVCRLLYRAFTRG